MTRITRFEYEPFFFHFGNLEESPGEGLPLVCLNGGIMADTGNEAPSYIFTCQDRYPIYAAIAGMRCLLVVRDEEHQRQYHTRLDAVRRHLDTIRSFTGLSLHDGLPEPLYMPCDINSLNSPLRPTQKFLQQIRDPRVINPRVRGGIHLNQLSPTISAIVEQFYGFLRDAGCRLHVRLADYHRMAQCALEWHNKARYVELVKRYKGTAPLPPHVPTAIFFSRHLEDLTWERLTDLFLRQTGSFGAAEFFVKSGLDAAGEVSVILNRGNFGLQIGRLAQDIAIKVNEMGRTQSEVPLLIQPCVARSDNQCDLPTSIGVTYKIRDSAHIERLVVVGHVYEDAQRKTFIGSYMSNDLTQHVLRVVGEERILTLLRLFAEQGYRGPINLDAIRNQQGEYVFIYDCNPRLGGSFPGLVLKNAFERAGMRAHTFVTLGYRGRIVYPDLQAKLEELQSLDLLYTQTRQRGVYIIPSVVRPDSFDLILVNLRIDEMREFICSGRIASLSDEEHRDLRGVYL